MSLILGTPKEVEQLEVLRAEIGQISAMAMQQRVLNVASKDAALQVGADVKRVRKAIETRRKSITEPLQDTVKRVIAFARDLDAPLEKAEAHIRAEAVRYAQEIAEQQRKAQLAIEMEKLRIKREEEARLRSAAAMAETMEEQLAVQDQVLEDTKAQRAEVAVQAREVKAQGVRGTTEVCTFEITNPALVPREFCEVSQSLVRQAVAYRGVREIPGVRIFSETRVRLG